MPPRAPADPENAEAAELTAEIFADGAFYATTGPTIYEFQLFAPAPRKTSP